MLLERIARYAGFAVILLTVGPWNVVHASRIFSATHFYAFGGNPLAVRIDVEVFNNFRGDYSKYLWKYTVTNNSYDPIPGVTNGFSGLETALPVGIGIPDLANILGPTPSWITNCCSGEPVEWDLPEKLGMGIMPGAQGVFEYTSRPRTITTSGGWFHTWETNSAFGDYQAFIVPYLHHGGPEVPDVLTSSLVDPDPDLLSTLSAVYSSGTISAAAAAALTSKGRAVQGVAADGVSEVVVRIPADKLGEQFALSVNTPDAEYGYLGVLGDRPNSTTLSVVAVSTPLGPMAFAVYRAPPAFARPGDIDDSGIKRTTNIRVHAVDTGLDTIVPVEIVRPPVVLVHGLWGDRGAWNFFNISSAISFVNPPDPRFQIYRANYSKTNAAGFAVNAPIVLSEVRNFVRVFENAMDVAAVQADIVAHSMGGNIARRFVIEPDFRTQQNYQQGDIHRLITIDTPHLGSQLANNLLASNWFCKKSWAISGHPIAGGAIADLAVGSPALNTLKKKVFPISTHVIVGVASPIQTILTERNAAYMIQSLCPSLLPHNSFADVLGDSSDLIVSADSQRATGLGFYGNAIPSTTTYGVVHSVDPYLFSIGPDSLSESERLPAPVADVLAVAKAARAADECINPYGLVATLSKFKFFHSISTVGPIFGETQNPGEVVDLLNEPYPSAYFRPMEP
jgi:pimeloyl-ACP methyl ester carboxylesterase